MGNGTRIGQVRGLGSSHHGAHHWLVQRVTGVGNLVSAGFLVISLALRDDFSYAALAEWAAQPIPALMLALLVISTFWHARLGLQVMVEDYVPDSASRFGVSLLLSLVMVAGATFGLFSIGKIVFTGQADAAISAARAEAQAQQAQAQQQAQMQQQAAAQAQAAAAAQGGN